MRTLPCIFLALLMGAPGSQVLRAQPAAQGLALPGSRTVLRSGWLIESSAKVPESGAEISTAGFHPDGWYPASVPTTVFAALVRNHVYPDPDFGMNLRRIPSVTYPVGANFAMIPMAPDSPFAVGWWYRTQFRLPTSVRGRQVWLHFHGINNSADVWLNGHQIAGPDEVSGMYREYEFNVTQALMPGAVNTLAVEVFAPTPSDLSISFVDWMPLPPDKDMGLYRSVFLTTSGPVTVRYPQAMTSLDLPSLAQAHLTISAVLHNVSHETVSGDLKAFVGPVEVTTPVRLTAGEMMRVVLSPADHPQLNLAHPELWWPYLYGPQNLYTLRVEFEMRGQVSDQEAVQFGIREITSQLDAQNHRVFLVNGHRILIRGGGWAPDMLERWSSRREADELAYVRAMRLNAVRLEGKLMNDHFFGLCDRYGILVLAGWCCCSHWERWNRWRSADYEIAGESLRDQLRRLRNHPCMLAWLYGSDGTPPPKAEDIYLSVLKAQRWPNPYIAGASSRYTAGAGWTGVKMTGPYQYVGPSYWYLDTRHGGAFGFNTETSPGPAIPVLASLKQMFPADHLWPIDYAWDAHAGGGAFTTLDVYTQAMDNRYGKAKNLAGYAEEAQVMDYEGERAMFEAYGRNKFTSTGVIQWMLNNGWPSIIWHLYDYYLRPGGGFYGTQEACKPLHVQYSYDDRSIVVVNSYFHPITGYKVVADVFNLDLARQFSKTMTLNLPANSSTRAFIIPDLNGLSKTYFVRLRLESPSGRVVDRNFYWLSTHPDVYNWNASTWYFTPLQSFADFQGLQELPKVKLVVKSREDERSAPAGEKGVERVAVMNPTPHLAFFVHLDVLKGKGGSDVHPIVWSANDFELMPGEKRNITATYHARDLGAAKPFVKVSGWNVVPND